MIGDPFNPNFGTRNESRGAPKQKENRKNEKMGEARKNFKGGSRNETYTDLTDTMENIFLATKGQVQYKWPPLKKETEEERRSRKFYQFLRTYATSLQHGVDTVNVVEDSSEPK